MKTEQVTNTLSITHRKRSITNISLGTRKRKREALGIFYACAMIQKYQSERASSASWLWNDSPLSRRVCLLLQTTHQDAWVNIKTQIMTTSFSNCFKWDFWVFIKWWFIHYDSLQALTETFQVICQDVLRKTKWVVRARNTTLQENFSFCL